MKQRRSDGHKCAVIEVIRTALKGDQHSLASHQAPQQSLAGVTYTVWNLVVRDYSAPSCLVRGYAPFKPAAKPVSGRVTNETVPPSGNLCSRIDTGVMSGPNGPGAPVFSQATAWSLASLYLASGGGWEE
ncbi:hypothetical protein Bbelb_252610 [Branchiostoma belcheri]|nr:hypothetical protein Bbelb_252610 [Branchiostoma belcheri]